LIKEKTLLLKQHINSLKKKFLLNEPPESINDHDFFNEMKEETKPIFNLLEQWEVDVQSYLKNYQSKVYPHQIEATKENIKLLILHSYYIDIRKRFYMEYYQSIIYVLDSLLSE